MQFREMARTFAAAILTGLVNVFVNSPGPTPAIVADAETLPERFKPERVQFWIDLIDDDWRREANGAALHRTILCDDAAAANDLAESVDRHLIACGYSADTIDVYGNVLSVRLTTATVGKLDEQDYAAAALIDTCV